ncbi:MAG: FtsH protease activity modulator HflK [Spirochaetes bacterium]|nr:FtsH protease activity modulator HflK [Spirochaetota bacterium]
MDDRKKIITFISILLIIIIYFATGIYSLQTGQQALVIRFGKKISEVSNPGIHYCLPNPIEKPVVIQISKVQTISIQEKQNDVLERFTGDENLIVVHAIISYDIKNITNYIFNSENVKLAIKTAGQMCLTQELTSMYVDDIMTTGKSLLRLVLKEKIQNLLDEMQLGIRVISVELAEISPPEGVSDSFAAVSNARVKKQEIIKDAEGYANSIIPKARGDASSILSEAEAYSKELITTAEGNVNAFEELLREYRKNPKITLNLKMLETMKVIVKRSEVRIDSNPSKSTFLIKK